jgi:hypothetical protein
VKNIESMCDFRAQLGTFHTMKNMQTRVTAPKTHEYCHCTHL